MHGQSARDPSATSWPVIFAWPRHVTAPTAHVSAQSFWPCLDYSLGTTSSSSSDPLLHCSGCVISRP